ncbi:hypothetical protein MKX03_013139 [Papaver bracteatum]|nr:hypothetical protein MKX03_013139 [Papaver bracteatum]
MIVSVTVSAVIIMVHQLHGHGLDAADWLKHQVIYGTAELLRIISGPAIVVNCAGWKPRNLHMLVLARDDSTIPVRGEAQRNT